MSSKRKAMDDLHEETKIRKINVDELRRKIILAFESLTKYDEDNSNILSIIEIVKTLNESECYQFIRNIRDRK